LPRILFAMLMLLFPAHASCAEANVDVDTALVVSVDVSGSVDGRRYALQMDGVASALEDASVLAAINGLPVNEGDANAPFGAGAYRGPGRPFQPREIPADLVTLESWRQITSSAAPAPSSCRPGVLTSSAAPSA